MDQVTVADASLLLAGYAAALSSKALATGDAYVRAVRQFLMWLVTNMRAMSSLFWTEG